MRIERTDPTITSIHAVAGYGGTEQLHVTRRATPGTALITMNGSSGPTSRWFTLDEVRAFATALLELVAQEEEKR